MKDQNKTKAQLINELTVLRQRITELEKLESEHKWVEEVLDRRAKELAALQTTVLEITAPHVLPILLQTIVERAVSLLNAKSGGMYLCDPDRREVHCVVSYNTPHDYKGTVLKYGEGAAGIVAQTGEPLIIDDYRTWSKRAAVYEKDQPFSAVLSAPMIWQGKVIGVIHVLHKVESRHFTPDDLELLTLFANHATIAVENARLYQEALKEINKRKLMGETLEKERQELKLIIDSSPIIVFYKDKEGRLLRVNKTFSEALKMPEEDFVGKTVFDLYSSEIAQGMTDDDHEVLKSGHPKLNIIERYESASGIRWVQTDKVPIFDKNGIPVGLIGFTQDITERKAAEEEREKLIFELKEAFSKIKQLSGMLPICSSCKKIRNDKGYWTHIEAYIRDHSEAEFTHGICPECFKKLYPDETLEDL